MVRAPFWKAPHLRSKQFTVRSRAAGFRWAKWMEEHPENYWHPDNIKVREEAKTQEEASYRPFSSIISSKL